MADQSYWGDVATMVSDAAHPPIRPVEFMTWVGERPFESSFYFSAITAPDGRVAMDRRGARADLAFRRCGAPGGRRDVSRV